MTRPPNPIAFALTATMAVACKIDAPHYVTPDVDASAAIDAAPPDAQPCDPNTVVCDDASGRYVECGSDGVPTREIDCALGCASDAETCMDVLPSNGLAGLLDRARDDATVGDVVFTGNATLDTDSGDATIADVPVTIPSDTINGIRVFLFKDVEIAGVVKVTGGLALGIVADGNVTITGVLDVSADGYVGGPGAVASGGCVGTSDIEPADPIAGGGGGGHFVGGAAGGDAYSGLSGRAGGAAGSTPSLDPLSGGCQGGDSRRIVFPDPGVNGGGGGGAVQIVSRHTIAMTTSGVIDASGGGGSSSNGADGGGAGGSVLLEAPAIVLDGAGVVISTKGGAGAAPSGAPSARGADGGTDDGPAAGGAAAGYASGGAGGTDSAPPAVGENGTSAHTNGGGGGGSVGEARFNDASASVQPLDGAAIRSHYSSATIGSRHMQL